MTERLQPKKQIEVNGYEDMHARIEAEADADPTGEARKQLDAYRHEFKIANDLIKLGFQFREFRRASGKSHQAISKETGVSRYMIRKLERGSPVVRGTTIVRLAHSVGANLALIDRKTGDIISTI